MRALAVVKLGGSLAAGPALGAWLQMLTRYGGGRAVVVAGGGAFADAVRSAQAQHGFSDRAAHRMALLAMEQYAVMLADFAPVLVTCAGDDEISACLADGRIPVWLPSRMALADPAIPESWDVTSDSLAAWLARRLAAKRLILVKSTPRSVDAASWALQGLVDPAFPRFTAGASFDMLCLGPGEEASLAASLLELQD
jgi:dihydroneopterin aldolase